MMGVTYLLTSARMAEMKRAVDWVTFFVLQEVLLFAVAGVLFTVALLGVFPMDFNLIWAITWTTVLSSIVLTLINCVLLRTITPVLKRSGLYSGKMMTT
jgi:hypothetical protein